MSRIEIAIEGMTCNHCAMTVTNELATLKGVANIQVDPKAGTATLEVDGVSNDELAAAVTEAGYAATGFTLLNA